MILKRTKRSCVVRSENIKIRSDGIEKDLLSLIRLLQEKAQFFALSETDKTRVHCYMNSEDWLVSHLRKAGQMEQVFLFFHIFIFQKK